MPAIPIVIFDKGFVNVEPGTLLNPPSEILSNSQKAFYSRLRPGWHICPLGYHVYCTRDPLGRKLVIPGIIAAGEKSPKRKFPDYPLKFTKTQVEKFAISHTNIYQHIKNERDKEIKNLTHDLRAISTEIYHSGISSRDLIDNGNQELRQKIDLIINSQSMMSMRLDIIDYESGTSSSRPPDFIAPFTKVDKVLRCFEGKFLARRMSRKIDGKSRGQIYGPPIFEIVPFVIVENALKYAPHGSDLVVRFTEQDQKIIIRFESLGPEIKAKEKHKIFERDYRGEKARENSQHGSGIGLFAAKTIVENHFDGQIFVNQLEGSAWIDGQFYFKTRFTVVLPAKQALDSRR